MVAFDPFCPDSRNMLDCQRKMEEEVHSSIVDAFVPLVAVD